jgi:hypothetical protein
MGTIPYIKKLIYFIGPITDHRIGFSGSCLPISEKTAMITLPCVIQNLHSNGVEDPLLIYIFLGSSANLKKGYVK